MELEIKFREGKKGEEEIYFRCYCCYFTLRKFSAIKNE